MEARVVLGGEENDASPEHIAHGRTRGANGAV